MRSIPNNEELFEVTVGCQTFSYEQSPLRTFPHPFLPSKEIPTSSQFVSVNCRQHKTKQPNPECLYHTRQSNMIPLLLKSQKEEWNWLGLFLSQNEKLQRFKPYQILLL